jgi:hypothetical protein
MRRQDDDSVDLSFTKLVNLNDWLKVHDVVL